MIEIHTERKQWEGAVAYVRYKCSLISYGLTDVTLSLQHANVHRFKQSISITFDNRTYICFIFVDGIDKTNDILKLAHYIGHHRYIFKSINLIS
jgi:hypothetical protein